MFLLLCNKLFLYNIGGTLFLAKLKAICVSMHICRIIIQKKGSVLAVYLYVTTVTVITEETDIIYLQMIFLFTESSNLQISK